MPPDAEGPTAREIAVRIRHIRGLMKEIARRYAAEREAELNALVERLQAKPPPAEALLAAHEAIEALEVKPDKGRRKDLRRIEECIDLLERLFS